MKTKHKAKQTTNKWAAKCVTVSDASEACCSKARGCSQCTHRYEIRKSNEQILTYVGVIVTIDIYINIDVCGGKQRAMNFHKQTVKFIFLACCCCYEIPAFLLL